MGVFSKNQGPANKIKRNAFDLSFQNHLTTQMGRLTPVMCKEVIPGDTFEIESAFGLNFMPTVFPVQSKINATMHFFYVRNRTLWKDFYDWYFGTKQGLIPPTVDPNNLTILRNSSLLDYMGIPTTFSGGHASFVTNSQFGVTTPLAYQSLKNDQGTFGYYPIIKVTAGISTYSAAALCMVYNILPENDPRYVSLYDYIFNQDAATVDSVPLKCRGSVFFQAGQGSDACNAYLPIYIPSNNAASPLPPVFNFAQTALGFYNPFSAPSPESLSPSVSDFSKCSFVYGNTYWVTPSRNTVPISNFESLSIGLNFSTRGKSKLTNRDRLCVVLPEYVNGNFSLDHPYKICELSFGDISSLESGLLDLTEYLPLIKQWNIENGNIGDTRGLPFYLLWTVSPSTSLIETFSDNYFKARTGFLSSLFIAAEKMSGFDAQINGSNTIVEVSSNDSIVNPFTDSDYSLSISALPFRAYEMIYNSFYRDARNNPYVLDGEVQYNKFIPSDDGGIDSNIYELHYRNWEYDQFTTAQPTPQFGNAPLVGITPTGKMSFVAAEDGKEYTVNSEISDDGTISSVSYSENIPNSVARGLVDVVSSGISINDFRNVNAFQRFLETTMRRGLKAVDQLKAHFGVDASYNALDMPEFIGGISTIVDAQKINNVGENTIENPLGSFAGQLSAFGGQKHSIKCYCDEPGFIIGILCVHPVPLYSQLLPKFYLKNSNLDYYFNEFAHIGLQPVSVNEIAPIENANLGSDRDAVFGYQRAWYDYLSSVDEVHGLFRSQLSDFVLQRFFRGTPSLSPDFTVINPDLLNNIFAIDDISDKILGKVVFNIKAIRPIPRFGIPRID